MKELSPEIEESVKKATQKPLSAFACTNESALRRKPESDGGTSVVRPSFVRDVERILNSPYYSRYADKTQVFSLQRNDDLSRRSLHVQLVSRIARTIGRALDLNIDLIEAIALGHDIGHTPFGHAGEWYLDEMLFENSGRHFNHNIHSVRVLNEIFEHNLTLQTLDGIACHNGELELGEYSPKELETFEDFDKIIESCYKDSANILKMVPSTMEGCVVRISDIIAYLGKDRQDSKILGIELESSEKEKGFETNAETIRELTMNIIENSFGKNYIRLDEDLFAKLKTAKTFNAVEIYQNENVKTFYEKDLHPMMRELYGELLDDLKSEKKDSFIFRHHIDFINSHRPSWMSDYYSSNEAQMIVADYIASMTDDYFIDLYNIMNPESIHKVSYKGYFD